MAASNSPELPKKRKRDTEATEELEIDVTLPEPLSKKALRKAKKSKSAAPDGADDSTGPKTAAEADSKTNRSAWGIWIGNLPWTATKNELREFFTKNASIAESQMTRVHMPPPPKSNDSRNVKVKPSNRGFAYVDFDSQEGLDAALKLSESIFGGRAVLIKNSQSFEGRPTPEAKEEKINGGKPPSKRVFVGNLGFDVTKDDLEKNYAQCGKVTDIHMATFEDTGNCKGFAWITFEDIKAAESAVRGWFMTEEEEMVDSSKDAPAEGEEDSGKDKRKMKPRKPRKWFVSRLGDRMLRCEFAEDPTTRYKKRYGKDKENDGVNVPDVTEAEPDTGKTVKKNSASHDKRREARKASKVDARTIRPGAAHANAPRASVAIVESKGKKTSFD